MTDHSERDIAAIDYSLSEGLVIFDGTNEPVVAHFTAGADWAVKNDPRVLKLVEAVRMVCKYPDSEGCFDELHEALTEWSKP